MGRDQDWSDVTLWRVMLRLLSFVIESNRTCAAPDPAPFSIVLLIVTPFVGQLLGFLGVPIAGRIAADGFYIIMADCDEVMNHKMHADVRVSSHGSSDWSDERYA